MFVKTTILTLILAALVFTACDSNDPQQNRSVVFIESLNGNVTPVTSDIVTNGSVFPDAITVVFRNRPYSRLIVTRPDDPYGNYEFTRYKVEWTALDGSGTTIAPYEADLGLTVETEELAIAEVMIVTWEMKANPPISTIPADTQVNMNAKITFYGHEVGTGRETTTIANIGVIFADLADPAVTP
jgi:hypothetical protein